MSSTIATLLAELKTKLGPRAKDELDRLISTPEGEALLARDEQQSLEARKELANQLKVVEGGKYAARKAEAGRRGEAATRAVEAADRQRAAARDEYLAATAAVLAADSAEADERGRLEVELRESADPRLADLVFHCDDLSGLCNSAFAMQPVVKGKHWLTREVTLSMVTNADEVTDARNTLARMKEDARAMQLLPLTSQEITERINTHLHALEPKLAALNLRGVLELNVDGQLTPQVRGTLNHLNGARIV